MSAYFSGQGKVYAAIRNSSGVPGSFYDLGNCSSLVIHQGLAFVTNASGGSETLSPGVRSGEVPLFTLNLEDLSATNLATVMYGQANSVVGASVVSDTVSALPGTSTPLANINITAWGWLKNAALTVTYIQGVDYIINKSTGMLSFPVSSACVGSVVANYTFGTYSKVASGTMAPPYLWLRFEGVNTGNNWEPVVVDLYKCRLYPAKDVPLIADSIASIPMDGRLFKDTNQTFTLTDGQFLRIRKV